MSSGSSWAKNRGVCGGEHDPAQRWVTYIYELEFIECVSACICVCVCLCMMQLTFKCNYLLNVN